LGVSEQPLTDLGEFIRSQREVARISVRRLAELTGVSNPYLSQIERGLRKPSADVLQQIAKGLSISAETLYVQAGILDPDRTTPRTTVVESIEADALLTTDQKVSLVAVYQSFVQQNAAPATGDGEKLASKQKK
jgi:transcriptional regulator with XRE-family HTH domain